METKIDFVIPWVDGSDPLWQAEFKRITPAEDADDRFCRYRDWDLMRYWFRAVAQFAPWVNRVHFVTWGHLPPWLNTAHPKLHIVKHKDYIPTEYLPTFSSHTIELNLHRIPDLEERFVYFNDDMFLLQPLKESFFFQKGLPCDATLENPVHTSDLIKENMDDHIFYISFNDIQYINRQYNKRQCIKNQPFKWYNFRYGIGIFRNILLAPWPHFVGFADTHLPQAYLKNSFRDAWLDCSDILDATCRHPVRTDHDVNQWFIRYRQLAEGSFTPHKQILDAALHMRPGNQKIVDFIRRQKRPMLCIHDSPQIDPDVFKEEIKHLQKAFESILPEKSGYEL